MMDTELPLDLTEYGLMRWRYVSLFLFSRFLYDKFVVHKNRRVGFDQLLQNVQYASAPFEFLTVPFFSCYLGLACVGLLVSSFNPETLLYYFLLAKMVLGIRWENSLIWVYFFRASPTHMYWLPLIALECCQLIGQSLIKSSFKTVGLVLLGIYSVGNRYIVLECWLRGVYYPTFWFWPIIIFQGVWIDKLLLYSAELHLPGLYVFIKYLTLIIGGLLTFDFTIAGLRSLGTMMNDRTRSHDQLGRLLRTQELTRMPTAMIRYDPLIREMADSVIPPRVSSYGNTSMFNRIVPPLVDSEHESVNTYSSESNDEEENSRSYSTQRVLRPRRKNWNPHVQWELYEIPGYNEDEDSSYEEPSNEHYDSSYEESSVPENPLY